MPEQTSIRLIDTPAPQAGTTVKHYISYESTHNSKLYITSKRSLWHHLHLRHPVFDLFAPGSPGEAHMPEWGQWLSQPLVVFTSLFRWLRVCMR
jgi:hypothetical protein